MRRGPEIIGARLFRLRPALTSSTAPAPALHTLANGLRIVAIPMPWRQTVSLSVFVRTGSLHETRLQNGISHVVEHMAFKGTQSRDCQRINLDAEALGAEVNAHTDKDHTAFHIEGLPRDLPVFIEQIADIVRHSTFPADELERERQVIQHEFTEFEEDPVNIAFDLFDKASYGDQHAAGRPVIGNRANIKRFTRDDLLAYVQQQYTACNVVVTAAGPVDEAALIAATERAFGDMPRGAPNTVAAPVWHGGVKLRRLSGSAQCQIVLGFEAPPLADDTHIAWVLAAALLGEGMSSPLLDEIRERRGLAYQVGCSADVTPLAGQFVIDAATEPAQGEAFITEVARLLHQHADRADPEGLARARNQISVRALRALEQPAKRMEVAAQELFTFGHLRDTSEWLARLQAVQAPEVQGVFQRMLAGRAAVGLAGSVPARLKEHAARL